MIPPEPPAHYVPPGHPPPPAAVQPSGILAIVAALLCLPCMLHSLWTMALSLLAMWVFAPMGTAMFYPPLVVQPATVVGMFLAAAMFLGGAIMLLRHKTSGVVLIVTASVISATLSAVNLTVFNDTAGGSELKTFGLPAVTGICALLSGAFRRCGR
ncbi:hypothetical protein [Mycolicibacterium sp. HK-90]|uniref:hypothetical protein n=1 Tax=Mycolicibacterium sp. HK-90 TaxID=3056937 RepID=UPI0026599A62|nr:hypothetical protein [Mycolicibacterium sp. HK-90]WKG02450.1 hypothetical protein QU592_25050 [Mycolicibacterium sp. HK-90]